MYETLTLLGLAGYEARLIDVLRHVSQALVVVTHDPGLVEALGS